MHTGPRASHAQALWGRDTEIDRLGAVLTAGKAGITQFVVIKGLAGTGKTALMRWVQERNTSALYAKADQQDTTAPLCLLNAMLAGWLESLDESSAATWRARLRAELGADLSRATQAFAALRKFLNLEMTPRRAAGLDDHVTDIAVGVLSVLLKHLQPLVLLLDDVQWSDSGTLEALRGLARIHLRLQLTVVLSYRPHAAVEASLASIARVAAAWTEIVPSALEVAAIEHMVQSALPRLDASQAHMLSLQLLANTGGNAFAITSMLRDFDPTSMSLEVYSAPAHAETPLASLWLSKWNQLSAAARGVLAPASCMGRLVVADFLQRLLGDEADVQSALLAASDAAFVVCESGTWRFAHDSIHEALYGALPDGARAILHTRIAALLMSEKHLDTYAVARHVNAGATEAVSKFGWKVCAQVNRAAAQQARSISACAKAADFLEHAVRIVYDAVGENAEYLRDLSEQAMCAGLGGDLERCKRLFERALSCTSSKLARAKLYASYSEVLALNDQLVQAVAVMRTGLRVLGTGVSAKPSIATVLWQLIRTRRALRGRSAYQVVQAPSTLDEQVVMELRLLSGGLVAAYFTSRTLLAWISLRLAQLTFVYGNSPYSGMSLVVYAINRLLLERDAYGACEFARLGGNLAMRSDDLRYGTLANFFELMFSHWFMPVNQMITSMQVNRDRLRAVGDVNAICYYSNELYVRWIFGSDALTLARQDAENVRKQAVHHAPTYATTTTMMVCESFAFLQEGVSHRQTIKEMQTSFAAMLEMRADSAGHGFIYGDSYWLMICAYLAEDFETAAKLGKHASAMAAAHPGMFLQSAHVFFYGLSLAQAATSETGVRRAISHLRFQVCRKKMRGWARGNPANFAAMALLHDAEAALLRHRPDTATVYLEQAMQLAKAQQSILLQAVACERAAYACRLQHGIDESNAHAQQAIAHYRAWGAWGKVDTLHAKYPDAVPADLSELPGLESSASLVISEPRWRAAYQRLAEREHKKLEMQLAGGMAHQLRNAISPALIRSHALQSAPTPPASRAATIAGALVTEVQRLAPDANPAQAYHLIDEWIDLTADYDEASMAMEQGLKRSLSVVDRVLEYATLTESSGPAQSVAMAPLIREVVKKRREVVARRGVDVALELSDAGSVAGIVDEIAFVVDSLLCNALEALPEHAGGRPLEVRIVCEAREGAICLRVFDNGGGIHPEHQPRIFEPFFSTKPAAGAGLGLAAVRKVVGAYDGSVAFETAPGAGSVFSVILRGRGEG